MPNDLKNSRQQMAKHENYHYKKFKSFSESKTKPLNRVQPEKFLIISTESQEIIISPTIDLTRANPLVFLLTLCFLINVSQAARASRKTANSEDLVSAEILSFPASTNHFTYTGKVCNSTLDFAGKPIKLLCSKKAKKIYKKDKSLWTQNRKFLEDNLEALKNEPLNKCKMLSLLERPNSIRFFSPTEMSYFSGSQRKLTIGQYDAVSSEFKFLTNLKSLSALFRTNKKHELHHGFIAGENKEAKRANGTPYPFLHQRQLNEIKKAFSYGKIRVDNLLVLLDNSNTNHPDIIKLKKFSINYEPAPIEYFHDLDAVELLIKKGYLNKQLNILNKFTIESNNSENPYGLNLFIKKIIKLSDLDQQYLFIYNSVKDPQEKMRAVLYDSLIFSKKAESVYGQESEHKQVMEKDAYINEHLSSYPQLFQLLYPELYQYHLQFSNQVYRDCVTSSLSLKL